MGLQVAERAKYQGDGDHNGGQNVKRSAISEIIYSIALHIFLFIRYFIVLIHIFGSEDFAPYLVLCYSLGRPEGSSNLIRIFT